MRAHATGGSRRSGERGRVTGSRRGEAVSEASERSDASARNRREPAKRRARARDGESEGRSGERGERAKRCERTRPEGAGEAASEGACRGVRGAKPLG